MVAITHPFVSGKGDGVDATLVQPSNWNANHTIVLAATDKLVGRETAGAGAAEEIDCTAVGRSIIAAATAAAVNAILGAATITGAETLTNKTLTSPVLNTGVSGTAVLDEDDMASNSATQLATQQSIKAYIAAYLLANAEPLGKITALRTVTDDTALVLTDIGKVIEVNAATAKDVEIPLHATVAFPYSTSPTYVNVVRLGAGAVTITAASGVTLNGVDGGVVTIDEQYGCATLYKRGEDAWVAPNFEAA